MNSVSIRGTLATAVLWCLYILTFLANTMVMVMVMVMVPRTTVGMH